MSAHQLMAGSGCLEALWICGAMGKISWDFNIFYRQLGQCVLHLGRIECWQQSDLLAAQEWNLPLILILSSHSLFSPACARYFMNLEYQRPPSRQLCVSGKGTHLYAHINHTSQWISITWKWAFSSWEREGMLSAQNKSIISFCLKETLPSQMPWAWLGPWAGATAAY